jgi:hypothetical protein
MGKQPFFNYELRVTNYVEVWRSDNIAIYAPVKIIRNPSFVIVLLCNFKA